MRYEWYEFVIVRTMGLFPSDAELEHLLVGPDSVAWRYASDARLNLVMLYPLLLQVAHPTVGAGVRDFSDFEERPWERLQRSVDWLSLLVYGGEQAVDAGRRLRALHKRFRGTREDGKPYYALEPAAYAWVHATLLDSYIAGHAHFGKPMTREETERFYGEFRNLGRLAGVRERDLPANWSGFRSYFDRTVDEQLVRTEAVDRVLRAAGRLTLHLPLPLPLPELAWRAICFPPRQVLWIGGIGLMPARLRERLGITWGAHHEQAFNALGAITRGLGPVMPERLRVTGPEQLRARRRAIARGPLGGEQIAA
jgi:uncharacterized protein (DUF2236 family)